VLARAIVARIALSSATGAETVVASSAVVP
jgi:hypothetical protein